MKSDDYVVSRPEDVPPGRIMVYKGHCQTMHAMYSIFAAPYMIEEDRVWMYPGALCVLLRYDGRYDLE